MNTVTYEFSFQHPEQLLNTLLALLQRRLMEPLKTARAVHVRNALTVLIIDSYEERAYYIANHLAAAQYRPVVVMTALEGFTLFLQGECLPLAVVLGQEEGNKQQFFLLRLSQQMAQKFDWDTPFIQLYTVRSSFSTSLVESAVPPQTPAPPLPPERVTGPLAPMAEQEPLVAQLPFPEPSMPLAPPPPSSPQGSSPMTRLQQGAPDQTMKEQVSLEGQSLGRYRIGAYIGSGAHSQVYQAYDRLREQESALKAVQTDMLPSSMSEHSLAEVTLFQKEAELLNKIKNPHILPVLNCGKSYINNSPFIYKTMPYCPERSLAHWLYRKGRAEFSPPEALALIMQLADALHSAHEHHITYQNFKLSNVLIRNQTSGMQGMQVALADFAPLQDGSFFSRTPDAFLYLAPERWEGISLPASDQYGLAALAYDLLTGRPPYQGREERIMKLLHTTRQPKTPTELNPALPPAVNNVLLRGLAKKPEERFPAVSAFATSLRRCWG